jgi:hypothetical protein
MKFRTGFVLGCAAGLYATRKARQLRGPLAGGTTLVAPAEWPRRASASLVSSEKVRALGDLARERATDVFRGPVGDLARERVVAAFEGVLANQRAELSRRR